MGAAITGADSMAVIRAVMHRDTTRGRTALHGIAIRISAFPSASIVTATATAIAATAGDEFRGDKTSADN